MEVLAIIPARGESKRIPQKNIKLFHGKPLIAWTILAVKKSKHVNRILVSTDSKEIAKVATHYGAEVPFLRPKEFASHTAGLEPVFIHALSWLKDNKNYKPDAIILPPLTNPLKLPKHLDKAIALLNKTKADSVITVHKAAANNNPHWVLKKDKKGKVVFFNDTSLKRIVTRSQDLPTCYSRNDIAYVFKPKNLYETPSNLYGDKVELLEMDEFFDGDINTQEDWYMASDKFKRLKTHSRSPLKQI